MAKTDSTSALQTSSQPETEDDEVVQIAMSKPVQFSIIGSFMILLLCAFYYAQNLLLPIVVAFLSALVLSPIVRTLKRSGIHESISAFLLVVLFAGVFGLTVYSLSGPISQWIEEAPRIGQELRTKLKTLRRPMEQIDAAQKQLEDAT
ncbi:MAG: AI-2E family transporter, partial [Brucellaceae bacterium]|nr:AI-2E family transporter [Brucellaceae bacterium]